MQREICGNENQMRRLDIFVLQLCLLKNLLHYDLSLQDRSGQDNWSILEDLLSGTRVPRVPASLLPRMRGARAFALRHRRKIAI